MKLFDPVCLMLNDAFLYLLVLHWQWIVIFYDCIDSLVLYFLVCGGMSFTSLTVNIIDLQLI